jgi:hypothetical protein
VRVDSSNTYDVQGKTPLVIACTNEDEELLDLLLARKDINVNGPRWVCMLLISYRRVIHQRYYYPFPGGNASTVHCMQQKLNFNCEKLISAGADVNVIADGTVLC